MDRHAGFSSPSFKPLGPPQCPMSSCLPIWAIYRHPNDYPTGYVARPWPYGPQPGPESITVPLTSPEIEGLRNALLAMGLTRLMRMESSDPAVMEMWA